MRQSITLNLPRNLADSNWQKVLSVYENMAKWLGSDDLARWYGRNDESKYLWASLEPNGLLIEGELERHLWTGGSPSCVRN